MDVFLDSSVCTKDVEVQVWCDHLKRNLSLAQMLLRRAKVSRISWGLPGEGSFAYEDLVGAINNPNSTFAKSLSARDYGSFRRRFSTMFRRSHCADVNDSASRTASVVFDLNASGRSSVVKYLVDGTEREVVRIASVCQLTDDAVCRVLYCNHPDVTENVLQKGYTEAEYTKHSKVHKTDLERGEDWKLKTKDGGASQFLPECVLHTCKYTTLIRKVMLHAMCSGKYAESTMNEYVCDVGETIGASGGALTTKVHLCIKNSFVHIYPD